MKIRLKKVKMQSLNMPDIRFWLHPCYITDEDVSNQVELADHLAALGHCVATSPETLLDALQTLDVDALKPYTRGDPTGIVHAIDALMGFK